MKLNNAALLVFLKAIQWPLANALPSEVDLRRSHDSENATMLQIIPDVDFNFNVMTTLATAPYQGADIGEILVAASRIKTGDFESYYQAYYDLATRVNNQAKAIDGKKHPISARNAFFRASTYYRSADAFLHGNWSDPRIMSLWKQQANAFDKAMQLLPIPGKRVELQADNFTVPAIFFKTDKPGRRPTVILGTGYDGSMEDLYHTMGEALLQRGMNAIVYEGPGQPTVRRYQDLGFIPEWERVVTPIVNYVLSRDDVDGSKLALMGFSFGGILASRAAAFEHRLTAVITLDGVFDFGQSMFKQFGPDITELFKAGKKKEVDEEVALVQNNASMPSILRWGIDQGEWSFKTHSAYTLLQKSERFTLKGIMDKIKAPVFVGDGQNDMFFPGQAKELTKQLGSRATYHLFETASGAGLHCQVGGITELTNPKSVQQPIRDRPSDIGIMVFSGKPSRACEPCRDKRRKCDLKKPSCSTCVRMKISCFGYRDVHSVKIKDQTSAVIRRAQRQRGVDGKSASESSSPGRNYVSPEYPSQSHNMEVDCLRISSPPEELALGYFLFVFTRSGPFTYLHEHTTTLAIDDDIIQAIHAPALASLALEHRRGDLLRAARYHYSKALTQTNQDLSDPQIAILDKTLLRVLLLSTFEGLVFEGRGSTRNWELHVQGALRLLVMRGKQQFQTEIGRRLFHHTAINVLTNCIMRSSPIADDFLRLYDYATSGQSGLDEPRARMIEFVCQFARMSDARKGMLATDFVRECMDLDKKAAEFIDIFFKDLPYEVVDITSEENRQNAPGTEICAYKDTIHRYQSQQSARIYNTARLVRLTVKEWMYSIFDRNPHGVIINKPGEDDPLRASWDQLPIKAALQAIDVIDDMLASVPYSLELLNTPYRTASRYVVWPLANAAGSVVCPPPARLYIIDRLKELAVKANLDQAMQAANMLEERVPLEDWQVGLDGGWYVGMLMTV
ncbi:hypothetical protein FGADI_1174 [Fusarium gaditjirri]|uniref:Zn(2)-C6 fungal-type domain-containing protein n=1 Tax=Fusarium gaditjirri TaxID=282569 RepID=A0A8H4X3K7_9HYPO|nr:hypothetical protein FGADI_1174 [Fusarium gaditjirri]